MLRDTKFPAVGPLLLLVSQPCWLRSGRQGAGDGGGADMKQDALASSVLRTAALTVSRAIHELCLPSSVTLSHGIQA